MRVAFVHDWLAVYAGTEAVGGGRTGSFAQLFYFEAFSLPFHGGLG